MQNLYKFAATFAVIAIIFVSAALNFRFGFSLGQTFFDSFLYGIASISADILKAFLPVLAFMSWYDGHKIKAGLVTVLFLIFAAYSLTSSLGYSANTRSAKSGLQEAKNSDYKTLENKISELKEKISALPQSRPYPVMVNLVESKKQDRLWKNTKKCRDATLKKSMAYCASYNLLLAEQSTAKVAADLSSLLDKKEKKLEGLAKPKEADAQAGLISRIMGWSILEAQTGLSILLTLLIEFGSSFGFFAISGLGSNKTGSQTAIYAPEPAKPDYSQYLAQKLETGSGRLCNTDLYRDFLLWCNKSGLPDLTLSEFEKFMMVSGYQAEKEQGIKYYKNCRFKTVH